MILFPDLLQLPHQLRHPEVRDLAWVILAPPMLSDTRGRSAIRWPAVTGCRRRNACNTGCDNWTGTVMACCIGWPGRTRRLGLYYERLWQFAMQHAPGIELIAANMPIRREGHTLGELDMLLRDRDGVHHLELAIKLYLGPQNGDGHDRAMARPWLP
jgi:hypothetical protein